MVTTRTNKKQINNIKTTYAKSDKTYFSAQTHDIKESIKKIKNTPLCSNFYSVARCMQSEPLTIQISSVPVQQSGKRIHTGDDLIRIYNRTQF